MTLGYHWWNGARYIDAAGERTRARDENCHSDAQDSNPPARARLARCCSCAQKRSYRFSCISPTAPTAINITRMFLFGACCSKQTVIFNFNDFQHLCIKMPTSQITAIIITKFRIFITFINSKELCASVSLEINLFCLICNFNARRQRCNYTSDV